MAAGASAIAGDADLYAGIEARHTPLYAELEYQPANV